MPTRPQWPPAIAPAFAASLVIHAALVFALIGVISTGQPVLGDATSRLAVRLVESPADNAIAATDVAPATLDIPESPVKAPLPQPLPASSEHVPTPALQPVAPRPAATPPASAAPSLPLGKVDAAESRYGLSNLDQDLVLRTQSEYRAEVDKTVRVLRKPTVPYPAEALAAQRSGTVTAWLAISREGSVEEVIIVSGEPEFADAVAAAIPTARFLPAEDNGEQIRYYTILEFEFRSGSAPAAPAATANPADAPR